MTDIDRPEGRLATVTAFPGTFDPTDTETDDNPESAGELAKRAENIAMYALTRRAVSIREMEKLLKSRDLPDDVVATEIARLEGVGLLDDYALATDLAERFQRRKGLGASAVKQELGKRLLSPASIDLAVAELPGDQLELATVEARKRLSRLKGLDKETLNRRLYAYLQRRGFRGSEISNAIKAALAESTDNVARVTFR
ncbi:MAG: recombination regulator RecX [Microbacteriaceae bacterium]|nr:recombination regulator RecX [Microbacteriaceae bacterium]